MIPHSTLEGYEAGCRCVGCQYSEDDRIKRSQPRRPRHGTRLEYVKHKCRCELCRAAEAAYRKAYRQQRSTK